MRIACEAASEVHLQTAYTDFYISFYSYIIILTEVLLQMVFQPQTAIEQGVKERLLKHNFNGWEWTARQNFSILSLSFVICFFVVFMLTNVSLSILD